jgi:hypothetical protein
MQALGQYAFDVTHVDPEGRILHRHPKNSACHDAPSPHYATRCLMAGRTGIDCLGTHVSCCRVWIRGCIVFHLGSLALSITVQLSSMERKQELKGGTAEGDSRGLPHSEVLELTSRPVPPLGTCDPTPVCVVVCSPSCPLSAEPSIALC